MAQPCRVCGYCRCGFPSASVPCERAGHVGHARHGAPTARRRSGIATVTRVRFTRERTLSARAARTEVLASHIGAEAPARAPFRASKSFAAGMVMGMAQRPLGEAGTLGFRAMLSPDPFMGTNGYPLLFATGETANGRTPLIDRQHPHDLFVELSGSYSYRLSETEAAFLYFGLPGEPALGPPAFVHRFSGIDIPEAPITHHWLDSTHITYGVLTAGYVPDKVKAEDSGFRGREPATP